MNWSKDKSLMLSRICIWIFTGILAVMCVAAPWVYRWFVDLRGLKAQGMLAFFLATNYSVAGRRPGRRNLPAGLHSAGPARQHHPRQNRRRSGGRLQGRPAGGRPDRADLAVHLPRLRPAGFFPGKALSLWPLI